MAEYVTVIPADPENMEGPLMLLPGKPWVAVQLYLPEDVERILKESPGVFTDGPDITPEDSLVVVIRNHIYSEDLAELLQQVVEGIKAGKVEK